MIGSENGQSPVQCQVIIWTYRGLYYCRISASRDRDELNMLNKRPIYQLFLNHIS